MTPSEPEQKLQQIVQRIAPQGRLLQSWELTGGLSAQMTALEMLHPDGRTERVILRRRGKAGLPEHLQGAATEFRLLQVLHAAGLAAPRPYHLDVSGEIFPMPYLVLEYVAGSPEFAPANPIDCSRQMAAHLAGIHRFDGLRPDLSFLPRQAQGCTELARRQPAGVATSLDEGRIREALASTWPSIQRNAPVLLHGDFWPGNVLWRNGRLVAVIDWEDASLGDPLVDLAISRLDVAWIFGVEAMQAFTRHYQALTAIDDRHLPHWDLCAALRLARLVGSQLTDWAAFFAPLGRTDITELTIRQGYRFFVDQALEKLASR
ncbi:MAG: phosphotransferase family protein [Chloroflexota bacterium]